MNNNLYDKDFRKKLLANPKKAMSELNSGLNDVVVVVKKNTADIIYFVMPNEAIISADYDYSSINAAGNTTGTGSTAGTGGTIGCIGTCLSTISSAGSAGTAGSK